jgi:hypothetical protein
VPAAAPRRGWLGLVLAPRAPAINPFALTMRAPKIRTQSSEIVITGSDTVTGCPGRSFSGSSGAASSMNTSRLRSSLEKMIGGVNSAVGEMNLTRALIGAPQPSQLTSTLAPTTNLGSKHGLVEEPFCFPDRLLAPHPDHPPVVLRRLLSPSLAIIRAAPPHCLALRVPACASLRNNARNSMFDRCLDIVVGIFEQVLAALHF